MWHNGHCCHWDVCVPHAGKLHHNIVVASFPVHCKWICGLTSQIIAKYHLQKQNKKSWPQKSALGISLFEWRWTFPDSPLHPLTVRLACTCALQQFPTRDFRTRRIPYKRLGWLILSPRLNWQRINLVGVCLSLKDMQIKPNKWTMKGFFAHFIRFLVPQPNQQWSKMAGLASWGSSKLWTLWLKACSNAATCSVLPSVPSETCTASCCLLSPSELCGHYTGELCNSCSYCRQITRS